MYRTAPTPVNTYAVIIPASYDYGAKIPTADNWILENETSMRNLFENIHALQHAGFYQPLLMASGAESIAK
jgi:hypothetical protein